MELLRKYFFILSLFLAGSIVQGQSADQVQKAFKQSYASEFKGNYVAAVEDLKKVYKADSYECNLRYGWLYYKLKNYPAAMEYYQKAIDLKKFSVEARLGFVLPANASNQFVKAYDKYEEILKIDPYNSVANYWVGVNYYNVKKYDVAARYFELVVNMYPFDYDTNHMLGWTYLNQGKLEEARVLFQKALIIKPDDPSAKEGLSKSR